VNIREVARIAGVSTATVSRTINGSDQVRDETALRVRRAIKSLRYFPDTNARALGSGRTNLYGLIISDITNPFFPELVKSFEDIAVKHGQEILVSNTNYDRLRAEDCVRRMLQRKVDGVAIMTSEVDSRLLRDFNQRHVPLVFLDNPKDSVSRVAIDYAAGIAAAVEHLHSLGHTRIAFISGPFGHYSSRVRREAFRRELQRRSIGIPPGFIEKGDHTIFGGHTAMLRLLKNPIRPGAVIASNDLTAIGALGAIHENGLSVPGNISLVGFDDIAICAFTQPPLTTVRIPRGLVAETAFRALHQTSRKHQSTVYPIVPKLVVRQSTSTAQ
jgi:LacI family transcriptional regulator